ncbi:ABC transporter ATP-binding protein [Paracoccus alkanivorans]|uniref:ABC transporter ATP-binding protein n=1 Tax=Paracoccus alkanivorans TaxID=2116655 RepID=A0A3M0LY33_9RHOB|nr:ABC transporter ATP-binding protein [Paracoccus alkanivorans]RMC29913.1 ABC transporter ATP-binding protein [Paracoccus alkanivorans]
MSSTPLLQIRDLNIVFPFRKRSITAVHKANLTIGHGQIHAVVGESGSGKTMLARSVLKLLPPPATIAGGSVLFRGRDLASLDDRQMRAIRGAEIGMIFQEPLVSLNPALRVGKQLFEGLRLHSDLDKGEIRERAIAMLRAVRIPDPEDCLKRFPHEFSGGMRQRIMIASVMTLRPKLLLADEPTTALDAIVQKDVLDIMRDVVGEFGASVMLISHDLGLVARYADQVTVMEKGLIVEQGPADEILRAPTHPYTIKLLASLPHGPQEKGRVSETAEKVPLLTARDIEVHYEIPSPWPFGRTRHKRAVAGVSLDLREGEMLGLVGESGSGKSTLGRALIRLKNPTNGTVSFRGKDILGLSGSSLRTVRRDLQIVFQDPYSSLDPRMNVAQLIAEGMRHLPEATRSEKHERVAEMLDAVGLGEIYASRFPHELSGGQRQRVAIARALVTRPAVVVADEPVSALDVTVQAQILTLLQQLRERFGFSCLFISHDLGVVESLCDRVLVMYQGRIMEQAPTSRLFEQPHHPYTCRLMNAVPVLSNTEQGYRLRETALTAQPLVQGDDYFDPMTDRGSKVRLQEVARNHFVALQHG